MEEHEQEQIASNSWLNVVKSYLRLEGFDSPAQLFIGVSRILSKKPAESSVFIANPTITALIKPFILITNENDFTWMMDKAEFCSVLILANSIIDSSDTTEHYVNFHTTHNGLTIPTFDSAGDPTSETLSTIEKWRPNSVISGASWAEFFQFCRRAWNMNYGTIREETDGDGEKLVCFVTGGWAANEAVQEAMHRNYIFRVLRWRYWYEGGLIKYAAA